jgi:hypothetical protein
MISEICHPSDKGKQIEWIEDCGMKRKDVVCLGIPVDKRALMKASGKL